MKHRGFAAHAFAAGVISLATVATSTLATPAHAAAVQPRSSTAVVLPSGQTIADVAARVTPSVVSVFTEQRAAPAQQQQVMPFEDPFFDFFFNMPGPQHRGPLMGVGSGVIISSDGLIMTNSHVVENAEKIRVSLPDRRELDATLVGSDPESDIALLRVNARGLTAIDIADSAKIRIGDIVLAIGNPFGVGQTVTMGIISAVGRANVGIADYEDFIQTDAAINPGNSGGALVSMDGALLGINTAIASRTGGFMGIGFAIPSNMALQIKDAILRDGRVIRGWLGVAIQDIDEDLGKSLGVPARSGVLVSDVTPGSPAEKAGLRRGDVIVSIDGRKMNESAQLRNFIALAGKNKKIVLEVRRDGRTRTLNATLDEKPTEQARMGAPPAGEVGGLFEGISVQALDRALRERLGVPASMNGVVVTRVDAASRALRPGDVIVEVNRKPINSVDDFTRAAKSAGGDRALLLVFRDGVTIFISLTK